MNDQDVASLFAERVRATEPPWALDPGEAVRVGSRMRVTRRRYVALASAAAVVAAVVTITPMARWLFDGDSNTSAPVASSLLGAMTLSSETAHAGDVIELRFPSDNERGVAFSLSQPRGGDWTPVYFLVSDWGVPDKYAPTWWSAEGSEDRGWPQVLITGTGPDRVIVPDSAVPGDYLLCTANAADKECAQLIVTR